MGFTAHRNFYGLVCTCTRHGYGVHGYGCSVGKPDLRVTCIKPYMPMPFDPEDGIDDVVRHFLLAISALIH